MLRELAAAVPSIAVAADRIGDLPRWPNDFWQIIHPLRTAAGVIPADYGGDPVSARERLETYELAGAGSVALALLLTQRDGAIELLLGADHPAHFGQLLRAYVTEQRFCSIGISQLTTSKSATGPAKLRADVDGDGFRLNGFMPWVSGALRCDDIVTGAVLADGRQLVARVPTAAAGVKIGPPMELMAVTAACTSQVTCDEVRIGPEDVVRGPRAAALAMRTPVKPLVVSAVALGVARALASYLDEAWAHVPEDVRMVVDPLRGRYGAFRARFYDLAAKLGEDPETEVPKAAIRTEVNVLVTQYALAALTAGKGSGFARGKRVERLVREAMFFHVWSTPSDVRASTLRGLFGA